MKELLIRLTICSLCYVVFPVWFRGWGIWFSLRQFLVISYLVLFKKVIHYPHLENNAPDNSALEHYNIDDMTITVCP